MTISRTTVNRILERLDPLCRKAYAIRKCAELSGMRPIVYVRDLARAAGKETPCPPTEPAQNAADQ